MTVEAFKVVDSAKGVSEVQSVGVFTLYSWVIKATQKAVKGGAMMVYDATITAFDPIPENSAIELEGKWYSIASPAVGMLGMYRHFVTETAKPI